MEAHEFQVVVEGENCPVMENSNFLMFNKTAGTFLYMKPNKELDDLFSVSGYQPSPQNQAAHDVLVVRDTTDDLPIHTTTTTTDEGQFFHQNSPQEQPADADDSGTDTDKFQWSHASTLLLIAQFKEVYHKFRDPKIKKKSLWEKISKTMQQQGYAVGPDVLDKKMRNLKRTYRTILDNNNKKKRTGKGRISWPYFELFQEIFHDDSAVNLPSSIISSTVESLQDANSSNSCTSDAEGVRVPVPLATPKSPFFKKARSSSECSTSDGTPSKPSRMENFRKRQSEIEEEKLQHLKKLCNAIEESNKIQNKKLEVLKQLVASKEKGESSELK